MKTRLSMLTLLLASAVYGFAQVAAPDVMPQAAEKPAADAQSSATAQPVKPDRAQAYYHFAQAHINEEQGNASKAIEEYKLALQYDPDSAFLNSGLAELYTKTGHIRDAVLAAQDIIKRDPTNLDAHRLLGRIYLRSLGDMPGNAQSKDVLKLAIEQFQQIVALDPKSLEDHLLLGRLYGLNSDMLKAESEFKTATQLQPDSEEAIASLANLYAEEGDVQRAGQVLESVPESARSPRLYAALGSTYEQQHAYKKAIEAYRRAVELDHDNVDFQRGLAQNLLNDSQTDAALAQFKNIVSADPQDAEAQLRIAEIYRQRGQFEHALDYLKKAATLAPDSVEIPYNMALVYEAQGQYDEAAQLLQQFLKKAEKADGNYSASERNNRGLFLERLGSIYREQNKNQLAIDTYRKVLALGGDQTERGYELLIDAYRGARQFDRSLAAAKEAVNKLPDSLPLKLSLAQQFVDSGQGAEAVAQATALLKHTQQDREVYLTLAQIRSSLRQFKEAEEAVAEAEKLSSKPEEKDFAAFISGSIYEHGKNYEQAEEKFKGILANDPRNAPVLNYLGYMLADRGLRLEEALGYIKRALEQEPQNGAYLDSLGWAYFKMGKYDLAEENLLKAVQKIANDGTIQDHLADLYFKTDRLKLAAAHWEQALDEWSKTSPADVDTTDVARVQKQLESVRIKLAKQEAEK